jgi:hypothetical protein
MPQLSKIIRSRNEWRKKSVQRATEIREYRKTVKRSNEKIAELNKQIAVLNEYVDAKKTVDSVNHASC